MWPLRRAVIACASVLMICASHAALGQGLALPDSGAAVSRGLQSDLQALAALVQTMRQPAPAPNQTTTDRLIAAIDRIRAGDLLIDDHQRALDAQLQRQGVSAAVLQRQRDNTRLFRERLDRIYQAVAPLIAPPDGSVVDPARLRAALDALAEALADATDQSIRTPIGATLPYRSLALPQTAPALGATISPAYLTSPLPAPQAADLAETPDSEFTPAIRAKALALAQDPIAIFEFVQNGVRSDFYYGAMRDADETMRQLSGNDTDQASLLIALLRASRIPARYVRGVIRLTGAQAVSWTGAGSTRRAAELLTRAGIPFRPIMQGGAIGAFEIEHTWVEAYVAYSNYRGVRLGSIGQAWIPLDPSFKTIDVSPGVDLLAAMGFRADTLIPEYLSAPQTLSPMDFYRQKITAYLAQNRPDLSFEQVMATRATRPVRSGLLPSTLPYAVVSVNVESPALADALRHRVRFVAGGEGGVSFDVTVSAAEFAGRRLTLSYVPATVDDQVAAHAFLGLDNTPAYLVKLRPVLKIGGTVKAAGATPVQMGAFHEFTVEIQTPRGVVPIVNSVLAGGYYAVGLASQPAPYEIPLARAPDDTEHPAADRLYSLAVDYASRWNDAERTLERILRVVNVRPMLSHVMVGTVHARTVLFGQPQSIDWRGVFVDADLRVAEPVPTGTDDARAREFMRLSGLAGSALEADVLQTNLHVDAVSAAKAIQLARAGGVPVEEVDATNLAQVLARLQTAPVVRTEIADAVNQGWHVTIPRSDLTRNIWTGIGYVMVDPATGAGGYFLSGGLAGGSSTQPPEDWPDQPIAEELSGPNAEPANADPTAVRFLTKVAITDKQNGTVDAPLARELAVWARDQEGRPVKDVPVSFYSDLGGATFEGGAATITTLTDAQGIARAALRLGTNTNELPFFVRAQPGDAHTTQVGQNIVNAGAESAIGTIFLTAPFQQFGYPDVPHHITKVAGDGNTAPPAVSGGTLLARLEDRHNNPIANRTLQFDVQAATAVSGTLPTGAVNLAVYPQLVCLVLVPTIGDCGADSQEQATTSSSGAAVETIVGNTEATRYNVSVRMLTGSEPVAAQTFTITSLGARQFGTGNYAPPTLTMSYVDLLNDRGQGAKAGAVGTVFPMPFEVRVFVLEDEYQLVRNSNPCAPDLNQPVCWNVQSREIKRLRPTGGNPGGVVAFDDGAGGVTKSLALESATVTFTPVMGGGLVTPTTRTGFGRYATQLTLGTQPGLNQVDSDVDATVWLPCFDLRSSTQPMTAKLGTMKADQILLNPFSCGRPESAPVFAFGSNSNFSTYRQYAFGVRAAVTPTTVNLFADGTTSTGTVIPYLIEPAAYDAATAEVDLFTTQANGTDTWLGYLITSSTFGTGNALLLAGTRLEAEKPHSAQLVLNRGSQLEIRSAKAPLTLQRPSQLTFDSSTAIPVTTVLDRTAQSVCPSPGEIRFSISRDATVTITVDGFPFTSTGANGSITWTNVPLNSGLHQLTVLPDAVPLPGTHALQITASFTETNAPDTVATAAGAILHNVITNAFLPVGHTLVEGVDVFDGHFTLARDDISLAGFGPKLEFTRSYSSSGHNAGGVMGAGWSHNWDARVMEACGVITLIGSQGSGVRFDSPILGTDAQGIEIATYRPQPGHHGRLIKQLASGAYDFYTVQGARYHYEATPDPESGRATRLAFVEDTNQNRLTLTYEAPPPFNLSTVTDASGRRLTFTYGRFGFTREIRLIGIAGPLNLAVSFAYDIYGNLTRAARGLRTERYEYAVDNPRDLHNLVRIIGPNNGVTGSQSDIMRIEYFAFTDAIPGESPNVLLFPEKYEIVKSVTEGVGSPVAATHTFTYDYSNVATRIVTTVIDPRQVSTVYTMHPHFGAAVEQRVLTENGPNVTSTRWAFQDGINDVLITGVTDALGRRTSYTYDANGNTLSATVHTDSAPYAAVTNGAGAAVNQVVTRTEFDPVLSRLTRQTDPEGRVMDYAIEPGTGNVLSHTANPGGGLPPIVTRYSYGSSNGLHGLMTSVTDPRDKVTSYTVFDGLGNATTSVGPEGTTTNNVYDARGRLTETRDTTGRRTQYEYDDLDRVLKVTRSTWAPPADLRTTITSFLPGGEIQSVTDGNGHVTEFEYDARNNQVRQRDVLQNADGQSETLVISRTFDGNNNKRSEIDRRGLNHTFAYDALNRLIEARVENQLLSTNTFDAAGNRLTETDVHGHTMQLVFDGLYRPIRSVLPLAPYFTAKSYDLAGNALTETDANGHTTAMSYDGVDRLIAITNPVGVTKQFGYDPSSNRNLERNLATGLRIDTSYDGLNRPTTVTQTFADPLTHATVSYLTAFAYDDVEHVRTTVSPLGVVTRERHNGHDQIVERVEDPDGVNLRTTFQYDGNGNLAVETDAEGAVTDKSYIYDGLNRRIRGTYPLGGHDLWFYDGNDNLIRSVDGRGITRRSEYDHFDRKIRDILVEPLSNGGADLVTSRLSIDDAANSVTAYDANNNGTLQEFDALHRTTRTVDPLGNQEAAEWDGVNQRARINKRGIRTDTLYDAVNRVIEHRRAFEGGVHVDHSQYLESQNQRIDIDANEVETVTQFDPLQRTRRVSRRHASLEPRYGASEIMVEEHEYDGHGSVTRSLDANGNVTGFEYDGGDRRIRVTDGLGSPVEAVTSYVFDRADNLLRVKDARANGREFDVRYTYDLRNRKVLEENAAREIRTYDYDLSNNVIGVIEPKGHRTRFAYDELNQLVEVDETRGGAGGVTRYLYDANRNRIAHQDASGGLMTWHYDALNRPTDTFAHSVPGTLTAGQSRAQGPGGNEPSARHWRFEFDPVGNQTLIVDAEGQRVVKTYDALDRITSKQFSDHRNAADGSAIVPRVLAIAYGYDVTGNQRRIDETKLFATGQAIETSSMAYDAFNRLIERTNHDGKMVRFEYDRSGNQSAIVDADTVRTTYTFDARNRMATASVGNAVTQYAYWPDGLQRTITHPNGVVSEMDYDAADRPRFVLNHNGDPSSPISRFDYGYDANGNRTSTVERHARLNGGSAQETTYQYDALNRLAGVDYPGAAGLTYTYASNGNRVGENGVDPVGLAAVSRFYQYDRLNQLTSIVDAANPAASEALTYDRNGNNVVRRVGLLNENGDVTSPTAVTRYDWDIRDFLARTNGNVGEMSYDYDYAGRRVKSISPVAHTRYLYDRDDVVQEYDGASFLTTLRYSYGPGGLFSFATAGASSQRFYFVADVLGSTSELTDGAGATQASYSYDAWGQILQSVDTTPNRRRYSGHYQDTETGLQYFGARYYDGTLGRFLTRDSREGEPSEPISQNPFVFAHANPLMFRDLDGHEAASCSPNIFLSCTRRKLINIGTVAKDRTKENAKAFARGAIYEPLATMYDFEQMGVAMMKTVSTGRSHDVEFTSAIGQSIQAGWDAGEKDPWKLANDAAGVQLEGMVLGKIDPFIKAGAVIAALASGDGTRITESFVDLGFSVASEWAMKKLTRELMPTATSNRKVRGAILKVNEEGGYVSAVRDADPTTGLGAQTSARLIPKKLQAKPEGISAKSILAGLGIGRNKKTGKLEFFRSDNDLLTVWDTNKRNADGTLGRFLDNDEIKNDYIPKLQKEFSARGLNVEVQHGAHFTAHQSRGGPLNWAEYGKKAGNPGPVTFYGNEGNVMKLSSSEVRGFAILNDQPWHPDFDAVPPWQPQAGLLRRARIWGAGYNNVVDESDKQKRLYAK